jgi:uncharacterized protein YbcI
MEEQITNAMIKLQKNQTGRGAEQGKSFIVQDMIIVRLKGVLTPAERNLIQEEDGPRLIKEIRHHLEKVTRTAMEEIIFSVTGTKVISVHGDISTKTGEMIDVFILEKNLEAALTGEI